MTVFHARHTWNMCFALCCVHLQQRLLLKVCWVYVFRTMPWVRVTKALVHKAVVWAPRSDRSMFAGVNLPPEWITMGLGTDKQICWRVRCCTGTENCSYFGPSAPLSAVQTWKCSPGVRFGSFGSPRLYRLTCVCCIAFLYTIPWVQWFSQSIHMFRFPLYTMYTFRNRPTHSVRHEFKSDRLLKWRRFIFSIFILNGFHMRFSFVCSMRNSRERLLTCTHHACGSDSTCKGCVWGQCKEDDQCVGIAEFHGVHTHAWPFMMHYFVPTATCLLDWGPCQEQSFESWTLFRATQWSLYYPPFKFSVHVMLTLCQRCDNVVLHHPYLVV